MQGRRDEDCVWLSSSFSLEAQESASPGHSQEVDEIMNIYESTVLLSSCPL